MKIHISTTNDIAFYNNTALMFDAFRNLLAIVIVVIVLILLLFVCTSN